MRLGWAIVCTAAALLIAAAPAHAADTPWGSADRVQRALFAAQEDLILGTPAEAQGEVRRARAAYRGPLRRALRAEAPAADRALHARVRASPSGPRARATGARWPPPAARRGPRRSRAPTPSR